MGFIVLLVSGKKETGGGGSARERGEAGKREEYFFVSGFHSFFLYFIFICILRSLAFSLSLSLSLEVWALPLMMSLCETPLESDVFCVFFWCVEEEEARLYRFAV